VPVERQTSFNNSGRACPAAVQQQPLNPAGPRTLGGAGETSPRRPGPCILPPRPLPVPGGFNGSKSVHENLGTFPCTPDSGGSFCMGNSTSASSSTQFIKGIVPGGERQQELSSCGWRPPLAHYNICSRDGGERYVGNFGSKNFNHETWEGDGNGKSMHVSLEGDGNGKSMLVSGQEAGDGNQCM
jgi:hypothetical protein